MPDTGSDEYIKEDSTEKEEIPKRMRAGKTTVIIAETRRKKHRKRSVVELHGLVGCFATCSAMHPEAFRAFL